MLEIRDGEYLWQWSRLEIRLNAFCWSTIQQKQFIVIIIIIIIIIKILVIKESCNLTEERVFQAISLEDEFYHHKIFTI